MLSTLFTTDSLLMGGSRVLARANGNALADRTVHARQSCRPRTIRPGMRIENAACQGEQIMDRAVEPVMLPPPMRHRNHGKQRRVLGREAPRR